MELTIDGSLFMSKHKLYMLLLIMLIIKFFLIRISHRGVKLRVFKGRFPYNRFCRKDRHCRFKFLEETETIIWKRSSQTTEAIHAIETILAYGSSQIELENISDDPYARIVSIARIASVV